MKWGQWGAQFTTGQYLEIIEHCVGYGITSFDHADIYGNYTVEEEFGKAIRHKSSLRQQMQLISKCGIKMVTANRPDHHIKSYDTSKEHILLSVHNSLKNLNTEYLDILLIHRPDALMNPEEIAAAFSQLQQQGKVLHFGVSNFLPHQLQMLHRFFPVEINQIEISLTYLDPFHNGQLDQCIEMNIIPMAWSPMGGGNLTSDPEDERNFRIQAVCEILAKKYDAEPQQIQIAFLTSHPSHILPVMGTSKHKRLELALKASDIPLEREEWYMLWRAAMGHEVP